MDGDARDPDAIPEKCEVRVVQCAFFVDQGVEEVECTAASRVFDRDRRRVDTETPVDVACCPLAELDYEFAGRAGGDRLRNSPPSSLAVPTSVLSVRYVARSSLAPVGSVELSPMHDTINMAPTSSAPSKL